MTVKTFIQKIQEYYGHYPPGQIRVIAYYLKKKSEKYLSKLYEKLIYGYSSKWGKPPDVAIFEEYRSDILGDLAAEQYVDPEMKRKVAEMLGELLKQLKSR